MVLAALLKAAKLIRWRSLSSHEHSAKFIVLNQERIMIGLSWEERWRLILVNAQTSLQPRAGALITGSGA